MGTGVSSAHQPAYLTRSTMLIAHTPIRTTSTVSNCHLRRHSTTMSSPSISAQLQMPLQFYPNNVYHSNANHQPRAPSAPPQETPPSYASIYPHLS